MAGIFISYRRADSDGWTGRLRDTLRNRFGKRVFHDVDNIPDGEIFSEVIARALKECAVALIIIGPNWANARDERGRRLDQEDDWVRTEAAMVLARKIRVIPVLVGGATLPRPEELPPELRSITKRQAREIRSTSWDSDVGLLIDQLEQIMGPRGGMVRRYALPAGGLAALAVIAGIYHFSQSPAREQSDRPTAVARKTEPIAQEEPPRVLPPSASTSAPVMEAVPKAQSPATPPVAIASAPVSEAVPKAQSPATPPVANVPAPVIESAPKAPPPAAQASGSPPLPKATPAPRASVESPTKIQPQAKPPASAANAERKQPSLAAPEPAKRTQPPLASSKPLETHNKAAGEPEERTAAAAVAKPAPEKIARAGALQLPNRPPSARELRIGDNWTYRLREVRFNRNLAAVTHEISGGDAGGIRESVRLTERRASNDVDAESTAAATSRRLALEPRMFERQLDREARLFEFSPFITAFQELQPGATWTKISAAGTADADWRFSGKVMGRERVSVPAGSFEGIRVDVEGNVDAAFPTTRNTAAETNPTYQTYSVWFVPEVGRAVKYVRRTYNRARVLLDHEQYELVSYQLK